MSQPPAFDDLPELMLSLRSFGSGRGVHNESLALPEEQSRFFVPLLDARRVAAQAISREQVMAAFEGRRLTALIDATLRAFAAERFGNQSPARRAFEAELLEMVEPLRNALRDLRDLAESIGASAKSIDDGQWALWVAQLRMVFQTADSSWPRLRETLADRSSRSSTSGRWRLLGGGGSQ